MVETKRAADTAKIVRSGGTQMVELPSGYSFETGEVSIRRDGNAIILEAVEDDWSGLGHLSDEAAAELLAIVEDDVPRQERPELDDLRCASCWIPTSSSDCSIANRRCRPAF